MTVPSTLSNGSSAPPPGIYVPTVTFFKADDSLDTETIAKHAVRMAQGGMAGLVVQGTNGESVHLDDEDRRLAITTTRKALDDAGYQHVPVIAGTGQMSLKATLHSTKIAKEAGAAYSLVIAPHYWPASMTKPVLVDYYTKVADESVLPVIIYNFPGVTAGIDFDSDTILTLSQHPNIVGAKFTCGNVGKIHRVAAHTDKSSFAAIGGKSDFLIHGMLAGSTGAICGLCNLFPKVHVACYQRYVSGDVQGALELQNLLADADSVGPKIGGIPGLKTAIQHYFGYGSSAVRSPFLPVSKDKLKPAEELYRELLRIEQSL